MSNKIISLIIGISVALILVLLYFVGALNFLENRLYDLSLRFRANRQYSENIVFLNIDDPAIDYIGLWPVPRWPYADSLFRLKEYETLAVIFDLQFLDYGAKGIDNKYLDEGLEKDFDESLSRVNAAVRDSFFAYKAGEAARYSADLSSLINDEYKDLRAKAYGIVRDNDTYLAQAYALNGRAWSTLSRQRQLITGEWEERRAIAENRFAYPIIASGEADQAEDEYVDILTALPLFSKIARGAGFTNYDFDNDGVIRRSRLVQRIQNHWYLQLSFAPLIDYFGRPEIRLEKNKLTIKQARFPDGGIKDIVIPLDSQGKMLLDFPKETFFNSYSHISLGEFAKLDNIEAELEEYGRALIAADFSDAIRADSSLERIPVLLRELEDSFNGMKTAKKLALEKTSENNVNKNIQFRKLEDAFNEKQTARKAALENTSDNQFNLYVLFRNQAYALLEELCAFKLETKMPVLSPQLIALKETLRSRNELNEANDKMVRGKFVIIGFVAEGTTESGPTPFDQTYIYSGIPGVILDTVQSESFIRTVDVFKHPVFLLLLIPLFFFLTNLPSHSLRRIISSFAVPFIMVFTFLLVFRITGIYCGMFGVILFMIVGVIIREIIFYVGSEKEKQFIRNAFSTYVSDDVVKEIIADPSRLQLGGASRYMTALFTDVRGFSTISEQLHPEKLVSLLNRYLTAMSDIVLAEKGTIDKYEGDAIIAFYGAPVTLEDHALRACISAIQMKKAETELNKTIMENNLSPHPLLTRIGINTGNMVAGNMGTANKLNYTIMGNAVNLAARLEGINKQYGTWILASEETIRETQDNLFVRKLDRIRVVGINEPVRIYELLDIAEQATEERRKLVKYFHEALKHFEKREWNIAKDGFKEVLSINAEDNPSRIYFERCEKYLNDPPEDKWDGVYNFSSK